MHQNLVAKFRMFVRMYERSTPQQLEEFAAKVKALPYKEFLKSEYWQLVRVAVFERESGAYCHWCGQGGADIHHKTYAHHGMEHKHLDDLVVMCRDCHRIHHTGGRLPHRRYRAMTMAERYAHDQEVETAKEREAAKKR